MHQVAAGKLDFAVRKAKPRRAKTTKSKKNAIDLGVYYMVGWSEHIFHSRRTALTAGGTALTAGASRWRSSFNVKLNKHQVFSRLGCAVACAMLLLREDTFHVQFVF